MSRQASLQLRPGARTPDESGRATGHSPHTANNAPTSNFTPMRPRSFAAICHDILHFSARNFTILPARHDFRNRK